MFVSSAIFSSLSEDPPWELAKILTQIPISFLESSSTGFSHYESTSAHPGIRGGKVEYIPLKNPVTTLLTELVHYAKAASNHRHEPSIDGDSSERKCAETYTK